MVTVADRQLYVVDSGACPGEQCIWRVSPVVSRAGTQFINWLHTDADEPLGALQSLSVTSSTLLVTFEDRLHQYGTTSDDRCYMQRAILLPNYVTNLYHGVETRRGTCVVGHRGTESSDLQAAVSKAPKSVKSISQSDKQSLTWALEAFESWGSKQCPGPWRARGARAYNGGLGAEPPAGSRDRALGGESGGEAPLKLKAFWFLNVPPSGKTLRCLSRFDSV